LCEGYYSFFEHTEPYMKVMKELLDKGLPPAMVMQWAGNK
jgi:sulfatase maturation enzyme AslB (radical SAM superfamily)